MAAKQRKSNRRTRARPQRPREVGESRAAEAVTVAWMLTTVATVGAIVLSALSWIVVAVAFNAEENGKQAALLPALLLYIAVITGIVGLILTPITHRVRNSLPPRSVTTFAVIVGFTPLAILLLLTLFP